MELPNPYGNPQLTHPLNAYNSRPHGALQFQNQNAGATNEDPMGRQSQTRLPVYKRLQHRVSTNGQSCTRPISRPLIQRAVNDISHRAFDPKKDCVVCKAVAQNQRKPHRKHHPRCEGNTKTRGHSATEVASNRCSACLKRHFSARMTDPGKEKQLTGGTTPGVDQYLVRTVKKYQRVQTGKVSVMETNSAIAIKMLVPTSSPQEVAIFLEKSIATKLKQPPPNKTVPPAMLALATEIMDQVRHKKPRQIAESVSLPQSQPFKEANARFISIFGSNNIVYTVPYVMDSRRLIDPHFHSIAGSKFIYMDFEVAFPDLELACYQCSSSDLCRERDYWSHHKRLFPVVDDSNEIWCLPFRYQCNCCKHVFSTNEGRFLATLPAFIRNQYPVDPRYADGPQQTHLSKPLTGDMEEGMLQFSSAAQFTKKIYRRKNEAFLEKMEDYYSRPNIAGAYPPLQEVVRTYPPSDQDCRNQFKCAQDSVLNPEGMAANDRFDRMIQATSIGELLAIDHTFETLKNYRLEGGKAIFTVLNEKGQICTLGIVASQKLQEVDHLLNAMLKRKGMNFNDGKRRGLYTDTWPNSETYWIKRLGPNTKGTLGLFHFNQRVTKHLNPMHPHFHLVKDRFQRSVYRYNQDDMDGLMKAFRDGSIKKQGDGEPYTNKEVDELRLSKNWTRNYTKYLRKGILSGDEVNRNLHDFGVWVQGFLKTTPELIEVFTTSVQKFMDQLENNRLHANHIQDPEGIEMYRGIQPGKRALIPLLVWLSKRPESLLEMFHGLLRHFANGGMRPEVADSLTLRGAAEYNLLREHRVQQMENNGGDVDCCWEFVPGYLRDRPLWYNHARLHFLNVLAIAKGMEPPFPHIKAMAPNTGEVFLSKYFSEQKERNTLGKTMDGLCTCKECESCAIQFDTTAASPVVNAPGHERVEELVSNLKDFATFQILR